MVREALQVTEVAIKLSALGIKNALALSLAYAKENPKVKGKTSLDRLLREGKELKIIALQSKDVGQFKELAKQYGVLFAVVKDKAQNEKVDVMFKAEDVAKLNRIYIECCRPWRDSVCVICNDSGKIDGLPPNRLYGHTDFLAGSFVVCGNGGEDFISLTDRQVFLYERLYHNPVVFLPTPHGLLPMKCTPEQYEQFQRDGNKLKIKPIDHGER